MGVVNSTLKPLKLTVIWDGRDDKIPTGQTPWARVTMRHATGGQSSLSNLAGVKRFTYTGTLFIQLFVPKNSNMSVMDNVVDKLQVSLTSFKDSNLWLRDVQRREIGRDGDFYSVNVLASFSYDDVR